MCLEPLRLVLRGLLVSAALPLFSLAQNPYRIDDGTSELVLGLGTGGQLCWIHGYDAVGGADMIAGVSTALGRASMPGGSVPNGTPLTVYVWEDPNDDGNPADAQLLASAVSTVQLVDTDSLQTIALSAPVSVTGRFFVGAMTPFDGTHSTAAMDTDTPSLGRAWMVVNQTATFHPDVLTANTFPPQELGAFEFHAVFLLAAERQVALPFCFGDGTGTPCPCGNASAPGAGTGCLHSLGTGGRLDASGTPSVAQDTFILLGSGMSESSALYYQGTTRMNGGAGSVFGDGLRCAGGSIVRIGTKVNSGGSSTYPQPGDAPVSVRGGITAGSVRTYQVWYRNAAPTFCTPFTFNLSNGLETTWSP